MSQRQRILIAQQQRLALNTSLQASIRLLRGDAAGLTRYLEEQAAENPHLRLIAPEMPGLGDWLPRWSGLLAFGNRGAAGTADDPAAAAPSLVAHVLAGVQAMGLRREAQRIALALIEALEPSGWLGQSPQAIAQTLDVPLEEVESVRQRLQTLDPPGLFARDLAECLRMQARDAGVLDAAMEQILAHLPLLAAGDTARLARLGGCDEQGVVARFRLIRAMNPKPGNDFANGGQTAALREPDLLARPLKDGRWQVSLNRSALPDVEVVSDKTRPVDRAALGAAKALRHMLRARNATLLTVGREIAARQVAALLQGPGALLPMTMAELAAALDLHESTISRVVAGASMDGPHGVWWLREMFSGARGPGRDEAGQPMMAAAALRHKLGQIIATEPGEHPFSDEGLATRLAQETGVRLARRTIAKYREMQGIPAAHRRKRSPARPRSTRGGV
jgi:RNA polymerase sigma-54 factor